VAVIPNAFEGRRVDGVEAGVKIRHHGVTSTSRFHFRSSSRPDQKRDAAERRAAATAATSVAKPVQSGIEFLVTTFRVEAKPYDTVHFQSPRSASEGIPVAVVVRASSAHESLCRERRTRSAAR
jgi:hypothetical protein